MRLLPVAPLFVLEVFSAHRHTFYINCKDPVLRSLYSFLIDFVLLKQWLNSTNQSGYYLSDKLQ